MSKLTIDIDYSTESASIGSVGQSEQSAENISNAASPSAEGIVPALSPDAATDEKQLEKETKKKR